MGKTYYSNGYRVSTDLKPRPILDSSDLTAKEREASDYLDWPALEGGEDSASFVRAYGQLFDLGEVSQCDALGDGEWNGAVAVGWSAAYVFRAVEDGYGELAYVVGYAYQCGEAREG